MRLDDIPSRACAGARSVRFAFAILLILLPHGASANLSEDDLAALITPPMALGARDGALPVWNLLDGGGAPAGYVFQSADLVAIPGFSGTPVNLLVAIDLEGNFLDVQVLSQNEPVFVSGLGPKPLHDFVRQYAGRSLASNIKIGPAEGVAGTAASANVHLDGVTKATASVRIVNETVLAAALKVAREKLSGIAPKPAGRPRPDIFEPMDWRAMVGAGLVRNLRLRNRDIEAAFAGTQFEGEDEEALADPDGLYADIWIADLGLPSILRNLVSEQGMRQLEIHVGEHEEPVLVMANGRHALVGPDFVRNSVPDRLAVRQGDYPVNMRDADAEVTLRPGLPDFEQVMALRIDRRLGFDPAAPWTFSIKVVREHGQFRPDVGSRDMSVEYALPARYFILPEEARAEPPWMASWRDQRWNLIVLTVFLGALAFGLVRQNDLARPRRLAAIRYSALAVTLLFVGWHGQGQLSIVNLLAVVRAAVEGKGLDFLLYDPMTLVIWAFVLVSLLAWGRGAFCGWLCPYGVLQEIAHVLGRYAKLPQIRLSARLDRRLLKLKYLVLAVLVGAAVLSPALTDVLVEVEPFKTAITLGFDRAWPYAAYAVSWLLLGTVLFKAFCRYVCPLGAGLAVLGRLRRVDYIPRRRECGTPCRLCTVRCQYDAIDQAGAIDYDECFQCLECVEIHNDERQCVPLVLAARGTVLGGQRS